MSWLYDLAEDLGLNDPSPDTRPGSSVYWQQAAGAFASVAGDLAELNDWPEYSLDGALAATVATDAMWAADEPAPSLAAWLAQLAYLFAEGGDVDEAPGWLALAAAVADLADLAAEAGPTAEDSAWLHEQLEASLEEALASQADAEEVQEQAAGRTGAEYGELAEREAEEGPAFVEDPLGWAQAHPIKTGAAVLGGLVALGLALNPAGGVMAVRAAFGR